MHTTATVDFEVVLSGQPTLELDDGAIVNLSPGDTVVQNGTRHRWGNAGSEPAVLAVFIAGAKWEFEAIDPLAPPAGANIGAGRLTAPMPGRVIELLVAPGAAVRQGQPMLVIEAMKMEHTIAAPRDGVVAAVHFGAGDLVEEGAELIALEESDAAPG